METLQHPDLFTPPPPMATEPPVEARQERMVLDALRNGPLTPLAALRNLGVMRLAAVVHDLKARGWNITTETITVACEKGPDARVAQYHLAETHGGPTC